MKDFQSQIFDLTGCTNYDIVQTFNELDTIFTITWNDKCFSASFTQDECIRFKPEFIQDLFVQRLYDYLVPPCNISHENNSKDFKIRKSLGNKLWTQHLNLNRRN